MRIGLLGTGNMGGAILKSIVESNQFNKKDLFAFDVNSEKLNKFCSDLKIQACTSAIDLVKNSDVIILACKPQQMPVVCSEISAVISSNHLVISIAAGIPLKFFEEKLNKARIIRVMPNMPLLVRAGMTVFSLGKNTNSEDKKLIEEIFSLTGTVLEVSEEKIGIASIAFSCMPGWTAYFMDAFIQACKKQGLSEEQAQIMIAQAFLGSGKYVLETKTKPADLVKQVASPGGITQQGLEVFDSVQLQKILEQAVERGMKRTQELAQGVEQTK
ncbi:MAG: pyrroline-5-carboxylate reductase [Candidatus Diapherotrites archaeon]|nr:pyrroline-5-carboxylate reductase [Candidatus Diapherotrites archaeon]